MRPTDRPAYSWRDAPDIPEFDDHRLLVVLDGACGLCSATAGRIAHFDRADRVRLCTVQSPLGQGLMRHYGLSPDDPESFLLLDHGRAYGSLDAGIRLFSQLHRGFLPLRALHLLPRRLRDWLYVRIARNRYRMFGKGDLCAMPNEAVRHRLLG